MIHDWTRFWTTPDGQISLADQGFLVPPSAEVWLAPERADLWGFNEITESRCLILLGEPGMGKSQTLLDEAAAIAETSNETGELLLQVDLGATREESVLRREIFESPEFETWSAGDSDLHLFLDSLDEAVLRLGVIGDIVLKGLAGADTGRLRLRLACRTSDRLPEFETKLRALWPEAHSGVYELAPLSRADVVVAASDRGQEPTEFVRGLISRDIVPLAIKPITLSMLLDLADDPEGLPTGQLELYDRGLRHLVSEPAERRHRDREIRGRLSPGQRLAVASRIGGASIISGRTTIATGQGSQGTTDAVTLSQLDGGTERDRSAAVAEPFSISEDGLREVLGTGLFSARGDDLGWAHQTYGEFLAGRYLTGTDMSVPQMTTLLVADPDDGRVVPQLRDVAGWAATMDSGFMDELAGRDPLVLLRGDVGLATADQKTRLAEALLEERVAEELDRWDPRNRRNLRALTHVGLETVVRQRLTNPDEAESVRQLACGLADLCGLERLQADLLAVALTSEEPVRLRAEAVRALKTVADNSVRRELVPLARDPLPEDVDDDLKGATLKAVCPSVINATEVLGWLTPQKERALTGAYASFLYRDLPNALEEGELPAALAWVRRLPRSHDPMDEMGRLSEQILVRSAEAMHRGDILAALAETVARYLEDHEDLQSFRTRDTSDAFSIERNRRLLLKALLPFVREGTLDPLAVVMSTPRLVTGSDLGWLVEQLGDAVGGSDEPIWAELIDWAASFEGADHDLVMVARDASPALYEQTRMRFGPVDLNSELAARLRERFRHEQEWAEEERRLAAEAPDFDGNIDLLLDRVESGDPSAFWQLSIHIWGEQGERSLTTGGSDLTTSPGWRRAPPSRQSRIAVAAASYLRDYEPSEKWLDPGQRYHPSAAGYRALRYLAEHDPESFNALGQTTLCRWVPAVLTFTHNGGDEDEQAFSEWVLKLLEERCPGALARATRLLLLAEAEHDNGTLFVLYRVRPVLGGALGSALLGLWQAKTLRVKPEVELLAALLRAEVEGAVEAGLAALEDGALASSPERARGLAAALLGSGGPTTWRRVKPLLDERPEWGAEVLEELAADWDRPGDFRTELSEDESAELYIWLDGRFPPQDDPSRLGVGFVSARAQVSEYRDQILTLLRERGSDGALHALDRIETATGRDLRYVRIRAEEAWRLQRWIPPRPEDVVRLTADAKRRVVLSAGDLHRVTIEALEEIQQMLSGEGQAHQVWDTAAGRPKQETEVAAWIADRLREILRSRRIIINREVEVRVNPSGGLGDRTDIHIDAIAGERVEGAEQVTVVVEIKGCWNPGLLSAMREQLVERYLSLARRHGIYLPVWFGPHGWDAESDRRREACGRLDRVQVVQELERQAEAFRPEGFGIEAIVLDASLR